MPTTGRASVAVVQRQTEGFEQRPLGARSSRRGRRRSNGAGRKRIARRIPLVGVDAVQDADERSRAARASRRRSRSHTRAAESPPRRSGSPWSRASAKLTPALRKLRRSKNSNPPIVKSSQPSPSRGTHALSKIALIGEVVDGEHGTGAGSLDCARAGREPGTVRDRRAPGRPASRGRGRCGRLAAAGEPVEAAAVSNAEADRVVGVVGAPFVVDAGAVVERRAVEEQNARARTERRLVDPDVERAPATSRRRTRSEPPASMPRYRGVTG